MTMFEFYVHLNLPFKYLCEYTWKFSESYISKTACVHDKLHQVVRPKPDLTGQAVPGNSAKINLVAPYGAFVKSALQFNLNFEKGTLIG